MKRKTWHQIHKWIAVSLGLFLLAWTVSGVVMTLPSKWFPPTKKSQPVSIDFRAVQFSPADAISQVERLEGKSLDVVDVDVVFIRGNYVYLVVTSDGQVHHIDARSGEEFEITPEYAERIARDVAGTQAKPEKIELITKHDFLYPFGQVPVYRVIFEGDNSNIYYVSPITGSITTSNSSTRIRAAIVSLHTFEPLKLVTKNDNIRQWLLVATGMIGIATALTGYVIFLLPYIQKRSRRAKSQVPGDDLEGLASQ